MRAVARTSRAGIGGAARVARPGRPGRVTAEVRRTATVVNSDLKGSTALGERLDPETLREVLTLYFDEMRAVFESHGGTIEKIIGDAIVAVFGLPIRHDDDPLRAVEAAAESQRALAALNDALEQRWGVRLVVRTGVATGDVLFGEASAGSHVLTGPTMTISSAIEQHAPPLEVLIDGSTYELVRGMVTVEAVEPITPKGSTESARRIDSSRSVPGRNLGRSPSRRSRQGCGCARRAATRTRITSPTVGRVAGR